VLALFAMLLGALVTDMPAPPDALAIAGGDISALCGADAGAPNDHDPGPAPTHRHVCPCCLTQQMNWAAIFPTPAGLAEPVMLGIDRPIVGLPAPPVLRPSGNSRPRAPPPAT